MAFTDAAELGPRCWQSSSSQATRQPNHSFSAIEKYLQEHPGNHVAMEPELPYLTSVLQEAEEELARDEVSMRELTERHEERLSAIRQLRSTLKPSIHHLPVEILSQVFLICWEETSEWWSSSFRSTRPRRNPSIALTLSHICSKWRTILLSLPELWSRLQFSFGYDISEETARNFRSFAKVCLERSKDKPLSFAIETPCSNTFTIHIPILMDLLPHSYRWQDVNLDMGTENFHLPLVIPMLERLTIRMPGSPFGVGFIVSPRLRDLFIRRLTTGHSLLTQLNLTSLTSLRLDQTSYSFRTLLPLLQKCGKLSSLSFRQSDELGLDDPLLHVTSSLRSVSLTNLWSGNRLFPHLTLPKIEQFSISGISQNSLPFPSTTFMQLLSRSHAALTSLAIEGYTISAGSFFDILLMLPSLERLSIQNPVADEDPILTDGFLEQMTLPNRDQTMEIPRYRDQLLLPNLIHLDIDFAEHGFNANLLYKMILSRWDEKWVTVEDVQFKRLRSFHFRCSPAHFDGLARYGLDSLKAQTEGLELVMDLAQS